MTEKQERRERRSYTESFKKQMVELYNNGKPRSEIVREYDITGSSFDLWLKRINASGSSHEKDNRTSEQAELIRLRKENQQLRMENDILKQAVTGRYRRPQGRFREAKLMKR